MILSVDPFEGRQPQDQYRGEDGNGPRRVSLMARAGVHWRSPSSNYSIASSGRALRTLSPFLVTRTSGSTAAPNGRSL